MSVRCANDPEAESGYQEADLGRCASRVRHSDSPTIVVPPVKLHRQALGPSRGPKWTVGGTIFEMWLGAV